LKVGAAILPTRCSPIARRRARSSVRALTGPTRKAASDTVIADCFSETESHLGALDS
jgi:hypothetical protein